MTKANINPERIIQLFKQGVSPLAIAFCIGSSISSVRHILSRGGLTKTQTKARSVLPISANEDVRSDMLRMRAEGYLLKQIAEKHNISLGYTWSLLGGKQLSKKKKASKAK